MVTNNWPSSGGEDSSQKSKKNSKKSKLKPSLEKLVGDEVSKSKNLTKSYMNFLDNSKTPDLVVGQTIKRLEKAGFSRYEEGMTWNYSETKGVYMTDADNKQFAILMSGNKNAKDYGISFLGAHVDAPCLNLKGSPISEGPEGVILSGKPYGGIWPHTWIDAQVEVIGTVPKKDGVASITFDGLMSERGIHITSKDVNSMTVSKAFPHEMLKVVTGYDSKKNFLKMLKKNKMDEKDFFRGSWYVVPKANSLLLGGELIAGYGHDDRICIYTQLRSTIESKDRTFPVVVYGCSREEIGSTGIDGAQGSFIDMATDNLLKLEGMKDTDISGAVKRAMFAKSRMISADVDLALTSYDAFNQDEAIASRLGHGITLIKATGGSNQYEGNMATDEMTGYLMDLLDKDKVVYQKGELPSKLQVGGGGTISMYFAQKGIPVIDAGPPVGNMHGKFPIAHVGDLYQTKKAYDSFIGRKH